jgi:general secretion pathway protein D
MVLAGCAGQKAFHAGDKYLQQGEYDLAMEQYALAVAAEPERHEYRMKWLDARSRSAVWHYERAQQFSRDGNLALAAAEYRQAAQLDGSLTVAVQRLKEIQDRIQADQLITEAEEFFKKGRYSQARSNLDQALRLVSPDPRAEQLMQQVQLAGQTIMDGYELELTSREPLNLQFANINLQQAFAVLSQLSGIHFILDDEISPRPVTLLLKKASFAQVLDLMLKLNGLGKRVLNSQTILVYPKTQEKEIQYEDRIIQVFYLSNIEAKNAVNMLRTMLQARKIYVHEELNAIVLRDKPETVELARQILEAADRNDSEVVFDLELVEVSHRDVLNLGPRLSTYSISAGLGQTTVDSQGNIVGRLVSDVLTAGGTTDTLVSSFSSLESFYTLPTATFDFAKTLTDSEILANPKIRVKNRQKAKVHIGTREPIVTTNISTTTGDVTSTNVQYIDVGVKLDVEPSIQLDDTVVTTLSLEVSNILERETIAGGGFALRISTTNAASSLILKDGERTIIGGLIRDDLASTRNTLPFLGSIPIIGQLFTGRNNVKEKREILLSITPHIARNIDLPRSDVGTIWSGSEEDLAPGSRFPSFAVDDAVNDYSSDVTAGLEATAVMPESDGGTPIELSIGGPEEIIEGQSFFLQISAAGVQDMVKARLALRYSASLVQFVGVRPGSLLGRAVEDSLASVLPSETLDTVITEVRRSEGGSGVSGDGPVAVFEFKATGRGNPDFFLEECRLETSQGVTAACVASPLTIEME